MRRLNRSNFLFKPADFGFLIRLSLYGLVTGVCAFVARVATEVMIRTGMGYEANPFSIFPPFEVSGLIIAVTVGLAFSLLFLWGVLRTMLQVRGRNRGSKCSDASNCPDSESLASLLS